MIYAQEPWLAHYRVAAELPVPSSGLIDAFEEDARRPPDSAALHYFELTIIQFCRDRMAAYKYPRQVELVPEIPKTVTGKFLRRQLRGSVQAGEGRQ